MNIKSVLNKIVDIFISLGFKEELINGERNFVKGDTYCIATYVDTIGFLIEYAHTREDALKSWHEDSDSFPIEYGEEKILEGIKKDILSSVPELRKTTKRNAPKFDTPARVATA